MREHIDKFKNFLLNESKNIGVLYHYTKNLNSLISILETNVLRVNIHNQYYKNDIRYLTKSKNLKRKETVSNPIKPHISFTRVKDFNRKTPLLLIFDGEKISYTHKIEPYSMDYKMRSLNTRTGFIGYDEFEERIYNDLSDVKKYLEKIEIDFGWYNFETFENNDLVHNFNKCIEIQKMFSNTLVFGELKIKKNYEVDTLVEIKNKFPNVEIN